MTRRYRGFISYSQIDRRIAKRLHKALENYRIPRGLVQQSSSAKRLGRFFLDDEELAASSEIGAALKGALADADTLIVIGSPHAARSEWVNAEIIEFQRDASRPIFSVIARGKAHAETPDLECFPAALKDAAKAGGLALDVSAAPLAPDLTKEPFSRVVVRIVAGILDLPFDTLWKRERRRRKKKLALLACLSLLLSVGILWTLLSLQNRVDSNLLVSRSMETSREGWQNAWRPDFFLPALRSAIAAKALDSSDREIDSASCDLSHPIDSPDCALALSGLALPGELIQGSVPKREQDNIRIDIEDGAGDTFSRRMITAEDHVRDLAFSGDSRRLGMISRRGVLTLLDLPSRMTILVMQEARFQGSEAVALNRSGTRILVGSASGELIEIDVDSKSINRSRQISSRFIRDISARSDGWLVQIGEARMGLLDASLDTVWQRDTVETDVYNVSPFSPTKDRVAVLESYGGRGLIQFVEAADGTESEVENKAIGDGVGQVKALAINGDANRIAIGGNGSGGGSRAGGQVLDASTGREITRLIGHHGEIYALDFTPLGQTIVSGGSDFSLRFWDAESGREALRAIGHVAPVQDLAISADGRYLASASWDGTVRLWPLPGEGGKISTTIEASLCNTAPFVRPYSTHLESAERGSSTVFAGRPMDVCQWRNLDTLAGWRQAISRVAVHHLGLKSLDYPYGQEATDSR